MFNLRLTPPYGRFLHVNKKTKKPNVRDEKLFASEKPIFRKNDPFDLPRALTKQLRQCAEARDEGPAPDEMAAYLWINVDETAGSDSSGGRLVGLTLGPQEWLNVVDEAASVGVHCMVIYVGDSFGNFPVVWEVCRWAQNVHGMKVAFHIQANELGKSDVRELLKLEASQTCLLVPPENKNAFQSLTDAGLRVCSAEVTAADHTPPCDEPRDMVFVSPEGTLYTCGRVAGDEDFRLGNVFEKPLEHILKDPSLPRTVPGFVPYQRHGCDGCPPIMAKRMLEAGQ